MDFLVLLICSRGIFKGKFMKDLASEFRKRVAARGPQGEHLSLISGNETLEELKSLILFLCQECPAGQNHPHCPFRVMSGLSHASVTRLVKGMPRESCENLLELELNCRSQNELPCHS